jgi:hypothetical protein
MVLEEPTTVANCRTFEATTMVCRNKDTCRITCRLREGMRPLSLSLLPQQDSHFGQRLRKITSPTRTGESLQIGLLRRIRREVKKCPTSKPFPHMRTKKPRTISTQVHSRHSNSSKLIENQHTKCLEPTLVRPAAHRVGRLHPTRPLLLWQISPLTSLPLRTIDLCHPAGMATLLDLDHSVESTTGREWSTRGSQR